MHSPKAVLLHKGSTLPAIPVICGTQKKGKILKHEGNSQLFELQDIRGVIRKYGECLNKKKVIAVKDTLPLIPLKILPLASNTLIPSFLPLSEAVLEVLFRECL